MLFLIINHRLGEQITRQYIMVTVRGDPYKLYLSNIRKIYRN